MRQRSYQRTVPDTGSTGNHMESSVTRLLVATKMLLEALTQWSLGRESESQVSEIYVRLGNDFNAALSAFINYGIDMSDMYLVPGDLRVCLETCLSEPASPAALEMHLPRIREIIIRLLQGLKTKQARYKHMCEQQRAQSTPPMGPRDAPVATPSTYGAVSNANDVTPQSVPGPAPPATPPRAPSHGMATGMQGSRAVSVGRGDTSTPATPQALAEAAHVHSSPRTEGDEVNLRTLRSRDALERRASKRFSAYTVNKLGLGGALLAPVAQGVASPSAAPVEPTGASPHQSRAGEEPAAEDTWRVPATAVSPVAQASDVTEAEAPAPAQVPAASGDASLAETAPEIDTSVQPLTVFVQLGRQVRKVTLPVTDAPDRGLSTASLRMLFMDQFAYSPGISDFPEIYIKDPASGVSYQLENLDDVQNQSLLTLNIEPLDQIKEHVDLTVGSVMRELRELKSVVRESRPVEPPAAAAPLRETRPISDNQFREAGQRMSTCMPAPTPESGAAKAQELKSHYEAVQQLRHEFAILRQVQDEGDQELRDVFASIRGQVRELEQVMTLGPSVGRGLIESGKGQLDTRSQDVLTRVEDLQDQIEELKLDVSHRGVKPKAHEMRRLTEDIGAVTQMLGELDQYVHSVRPHWKKTWEAELQNIVDEQEFLNYQEGLLADLQQDHKALQDVFGNIQQVVRLRDVGRDDIPRPRYVPPPRDAEHEGLPSVMIEVRGQSIDHERRVRALQAAERSREKAKAGRTDEFASELAGFVDGRVLRKTGGHREAERLRQKRDQTTLKKMFGNASGSSVARAAAPGTDTPHEGTSFDSMPPTPRELSGESTPAAEPTSRSVSGASEPSAEQLQLSAAGAVADDHSAAAASAQPRHAFSPPPSASAVPLPPSNPTSPPLQPPMVGASPSVPPKNLSHSYASAPPSASSHTTSQPLPPSSSDAEHGAERLPRPVSSNPFAFFTQGSSRLMGSRYM